MFLKDASQAAKKVNFGAAGAWVYTLARFFAYYAKLKPLRQNKSE